MVITLVFLAWTGGVDEVSVISHHIAAIISTTY